MTLQGTPQPANPQCQTPHPHRQRQRRHRRRSEHHAQQIRPDAADDEEDGQVPEDDGQDGRPDSRDPLAPLLSLNTKEPARPVLDQENTEWRGELLSACLCGAFGLTGAFTAGPISTGAFVLSYLAGGWFSAQDVWQLLKKRVVDVHFLMLLVALGSASIGGWGEGAALLFLFLFPAPWKVMPKAGPSVRSIPSLKAAPRSRAFCATASKKWFPSSRSFRDYFSWLSPATWCPSIAS